VYVLALLLSLLTVGRLSDFVGRRPVLAAGLIVDSASMAVFLNAESVAWLLVARIVQGVATGAAIGVLGACLLDLQPGGGSRLGSLVNSVAPTLGLALGALVTGVLVQYAPHPTRLVFAIFAGLFLILALAILAVPETVQRTRGAVAAMRPQIAVPQPAHHAFARAVPTMVATWALGGLVLSVGGSLLGSVFDQTNHAVVGVVISLFAAAGASSALIARDLAPAFMTRVGTAVLAFGTGLFIWALATSSLTVFIVACLVAGTGFGAAFLGALRSVIQLAQPHERAALLSAVYVVSYLAFSLPALVAGLLITHEGLRDTSLGYSGFVGLVIMGSLTFDQVARRHNGEPLLDRRTSRPSRPGSIEPVGVETVDVHH
jgi:MFS family permease